MISNIEPTNTHELTYANMNHLMRIFYRVIMYTGWGILITPGGYLKN